MRLISVKGCLERRMKGAYIKMMSEDEVFLVNYRVRLVGVGWVRFQSTGQ